MSPRNTLTGRSTILADSLKLSQGAGGRMNTLFDQTLLTGLKKTTSLLQSESHPQKKHCSEKLRVRLGGGDWVSRNVLQSITSVITTAACAM